jgi:ESX secretion-associated protein EspG
MRARPTVEISVSPLFSLLQKENLGEPHTLFAGGERYYSPRFAAQAEKVIQRELADAGLGDKRDYLDFVDMVTVAQHATAEFYGWVIGVEEDYGVLVASLGRQAVRLVRTGEVVRFERCDPERMIGALVERLPDIAAGRGDSISIGHAEFHAKSRAPGSVMKRAGTARPEVARRLDALLLAQRRNVTKLYAAKRDANGVRQRAERWVTVLDLVDGRWTLSVAESKRQKWINAAPGTPALIADRLVELARSVR